MTRVVLVRHGRTPWNEQGRLQGQADVSLSPAGRREAERVGRVIATAGAPGRIVTSPLSRAIETAEIVAAEIDDAYGTDTDSGVRIETSPRWAERSFGSLEGKRAHAAFEAHPEFHPKSGAFSPSAAGDGESCRAVLARVHRGWRSIRRTGDPLVVVTHETPLRIVTGLLDGDNPIETVQRRSFSPGVAIAVDADPCETDGEWRLLSTDSSEEEPEEGS